MNKSQDPAPKPSRGESAFAYAPLAGTIYAPNLTTIQKQKITQQLESLTQPPHPLEATFQQDESLILQEDLKEIRLMNEWSLDFPLWLRGCPCTPNQLPQLSQETINKLYLWASIFNSFDPFAEDDPLTYISAQIPLAKVPEPYRNTVQSYRQLEEDILLNLKKELGAGWTIVSST